MALRTGLWLLLLVVVGAVVIFATWKRSPADWGFKDVVKNPEYWQSVSRADAEVADAVQESKSWSDQRVADGVRDYILEQKSSRDAPGEAQILRGLGERTQATILGLLGDPSLYGRLVKPTGEDLLPEAPFNRACDLLGDSPPAAAVGVLAPFLRDSSTEIRKDAALAIAKTGAPTIVPLVKQALLDQDEYVRQYALMGLEFALNRKGVAENTRQELFPLVWRLVREGKNGDKASDVLFGLSNEKAKEYFLSDEAFTANSPMLDESLKTLADAKVPVPRDRLLGLIQSLEAQKMEDSRANALGAALRLLGQQMNTEDREFLRQRTSNANEAVARGAADGLVCSYGLQDFKQRLYDKEDQSGFGGLTPEQKYYGAVDECDNEINNGGLSQYFVNSSGDNWPDAVAGFEAMGMKGRLAVLKEAIALFGKDGPSTNREVRQDQLAALDRKNDAAFDALDSRYFQCPEIVEVWTDRYVVEHADSFR
jgi:hypothetical protein